MVKKLVLAALAGSVAVAAPAEAALVHVNFSAPAIFGDYSPAGVINISFSYDTAQAAYNISSGSGDYGDGPFTIDTGQYFGLSDLVVTSSIGDATFSPYSWQLDVRDVTVAPTGINNQAYIDGLRISTSFVSGNHLDLDFYGGLFHNDLSSTELPVDFIPTNSYATFTSNSRAVYGFRDASVTFTVDAALPETSTWAMMLLGFGCLGYITRRKQVTSRIHFA